MKKGKFIHSTRLLNCYKKGQLDNIMKKFNQQINEQTFLGAGDDASTFIYDDDQMMKISTKQSRYFIEFKSKKAGQFKDHINEFLPYFLPVNEILYEDKNTFIYTQYKCKKIKKENITKKEVMTIYNLVRLMFQRNCIVTDIGPHNIGVNQHYDQPFLFDYHSLQPIFIEGKISSEVNLNRISRNLTQFMAFIYAPHKIEEYMESMKKSEEKAIKKIEKDHLLPECLIVLIKYLINEKKFKKNKIIDLIDRCIDHLSNLD